MVGRISERNLHPETRMKLIENEVDLKFSFGSGD